ncbi:YybH family protein [Ohtaekwangia sp.]|uniref:YybH family protein n=1 Tax=Ohtaekwangia sp. TaxID=2066019 RepID=UPI002F9239CF
MRLLSICVLLILALSSCERTTLSPTEMRVILHERNETLGKFFKEGDVEKLATMYTDSAKLCPNGAVDIYIGREAIKQFWKEAMEGSQLLDMKTETLSVNGNHDLIYETGKTTTHTKYQDSVYVSEVKFANVWKRQQDGSYRLDVDIWNAIKH